MRHKFKYGLGSRRLRRSRRHRSVIFTRGGIRL